MLNNKQNFTPHSSFQKLKQRLVLLAWLNRREKVRQGFKVEE